MPRLRATEPGQTLAHRVAFFRRRLTLTQAALALRLGTTQSHIAHIETGRILIDSIPRLYTLADALEIGPDQLDPRLAPHPEAS